jgi:hypothetical protein
MNGTETRMAIEALRFHADALRRQAKSRTEAGGGVSGAEHREALRQKAKELRGLANRLGFEREQQARSVEVEAGAARARERARLRVEPGEQARLISIDAETPYL